MEDFRCWQVNNNILGVKEKARTHLNFMLLYFKDQLLCNFREPYHCVNT